MSSSGCWLIGNKVEASVKSSLFSSFSPLKLFLVKKMTIRWMIQLCIFSFHPKVVVASSGSILEVDGDDDDDEQRR